jgi:hypothetical protein
MKMIYEIDVGFSLHALHAYQSELPGNFDMQGVAFGDPCCFGSA